MDHYYLSTACLHEIHDRCRKVCKYCTATCVCRCHADEFVADATPKRPPRDVECPDES